MSTALVVNDSLTVSPNDLTWSAARASGPGGQNVNKVASKVELRFNLPACAALSDEVRARLRALASGRLDADGWVVMVSQKTRDQSRNLDDAREKLKGLILMALEVPKVRKPSRTPRGAVLRRIANKQHNAARKQARKPVRSED